MNFAQIQLRTIHSVVNASVTNPNRDTIEVSAQPQSANPQSVQPQSANAQPASPRKPQNLILYLLVCLFELVTVFLGLLLFVLHDDDIKYAYLTFIIVTCLRVVLFTICSLQLVDFGKEMLLLYFCFDNVMLMMIVSDMTYIFFNFKKETEYVKGALICYPFLYFFLCGNGRIMLQYAIWERWQVLMYKSVKLMGCCYYLTFGCYMIINESYNRNQAQLFLIWIFTTSAFWGEMCFQINAKDGSEAIKTHYRLIDQND